MSYTNITPDMQVTTDNNQECDSTTKGETEVKLKSAQRDTNLRAGTLQPDRTF